MIQTTLFLKSNPVYIQCGTIFSSYDFRTSLTLDKVNLTFPCHAYFKGIAIVIRKIEYLYMKVS